MWQIIEARSGDECCLERLAMRHSYRVNAICAALGYSRRNFYDVFLRDIGLSPKLWMSYERMVVARRKLEGGIPMWQVAKDLGFATVQSFSSTFYKTYGVSPRRYLSNRRVFDPANPIL